MKNPFGGVEAVHHAIFGIVEDIHLRIFLSGFAKNHKDQTNQLFQLDFSFFILFDQGSYQFSIDPHFSRSGVKIYLHHIPILSHNQTSIIVGFEFLIALLLLLPLTLIDVPFFLLLPHPLFFLLEIKDFPSFPSLGGHDIILFSSQHFDLSPFPLGTLPFSKNLLTFSTVTLRIHAFIPFIIVPIQKSVKALFRFSKIFILHPFHFDDYFT